MMTEEHHVDMNGKLVSDGTWTYKVPTIDTIPRKFNVEIINSHFHQKRILSSKGLLLSLLKYYKNILFVDFNIESVCEDGDIYLTWHFVHG